jgi:hypothetical protein
LERRTNTYCALSQSYIWVQDCPGGLAKRVRVMSNDPSSPAGEATGCEQERKT